MEFFGIDWNEKHILKTNTKLVCTSDIEKINAEELKKEVEPWLSAIFQSEHLSLLTGTGLTSAVSFTAGVIPQEMSRLALANGLSEKIKTKADATAKKMNRGEANIEDDIRIALELINGLKILDDDRHVDLETELNNKLLTFIKAILKTESDFQYANPSQSYTFASHSNPSTIQSLQKSMPAQSHDRLKQCSKNERQIYERQERPACNRVDGR